MCNKEKQQRQAEIHKYLKDNLQIMCDWRHDYDGDKEVTIKLLLKHPVTGQNEVMSETSFWMPCD